jgi:hypothetical protein
MAKPSAKPPTPQPQPRQACAGVGVATVAIAKVPVSTNAVKARFMMFLPDSICPCVVDFLDGAHFAHVELTLETLTVDRKFLISAFSSLIRTPLCIQPERHCPTLGIAARAQHNCRAPGRCGQKRCSIHSDHDPL